MALREQTRNRCAHCSLGCSLVFQAFQLHCKRPIVFFVISVPGSHTYVDSRCLFSYVHTPQYPERGFLPIAVLANYETLKTLLANGDDSDIVELPNPGVLKISMHKSPKKKTAQLTVPTDFSPPKVSIQELEREDPLTHVNLLPHDPLFQDNSLPHDPLLQDNPLPHDLLLQDDALPQHNMLPQDNEGSQGNTLLWDSTLSHDLLLDEDVEKSGYVAGGQTSGSGNRRGKVHGGKCMVHVAAPGGMWLM